MRVNIDEIKEGGLRRSWDVTRETLDEMVAGDKAGFRARAPARVDATFSRVERRVLLEVHSRAALTVACGRCLAGTDVDVPVDFELTLVPSDEYQEAPRDEEERPHGRAGGSFRAGDTEEETFSGKVIDLAPILREQVLLALPGYPVCREGCKGLCPVCGANLNDRECGCDRHVADPRWAALKDIKLQ
ncbi:MAG TPA: DUF177 domain-containing protein [Anaeromyxobacteraceae bacterium]|nr:DUF177 domain-containing protein [Anaeromyxobacteraceae bacterium]